MNTFHFNQTFLMRINFGNFTTKSKIFTSLNATKKRRNPVDAFHAKNLPKISSENWSYYTYFIWVSFL